MKNKLSITEITGKEGKGKIAAFGSEGGEIRMIDNFKIGKIIPEIMKTMEAEGLTIEEAERVPEILSAKIKENNELHEKARPFAVHEGLFRYKT